MTDLAFNEGELYIQNDLVIISDSEALISQLYIFLNIRACHKDDNGNIAITGELEYDQEQGIDFIYITD